MRFSFFIVSFVVTVSIRLSAHVRMHWRTNKTNTKFFFVSSLIPPAVFVDKMNDSIFQNNEEKKTEKKIQWCEHAVTKLIPSRCHRIEARKKKEEKKLNREGSSKAMKCNTSIIELSTISIDGLSSVWIIWLFRLLLVRFSFVLLRPKQTNEKKDQMQMH